MKTFENRESLAAALRILIENWCERRCLHALHHILGPYLGFTGLTDSWAELLIGMQNVRAFATSELNATELEELNSLIFG